MLSETQIFDGQKIRRGTATYDVYAAEIASRGVPEREIEDTAWQAWEEGVSVTDFVERYEIARQSARYST